MSIKELLRGLDYKLCMYLLKSYLFSRCLRKKMKISFEFDVAKSVGIPVKRLFKSGIGLAYAEGHRYHAKSMEIRLGSLRPDSKFMVGKMSNGLKHIQFIQIIP